MPLAATATAIVLAWSACSAAVHAAPVQIDAGTSFNLKPGESAQTQDGALQVGFDRVTSDSRCPRGEQCIVAGDATARVWLQRGTGPRETLELHTAPGAAQTGRALDHAVQLVALDPVPVSGKAAVQSVYIVTLTVRADPSR